MYSPRLVKAALSYYAETAESDNPEVIALRMDIRRAWEEAPLNQKQRDVLRVLFLEEGGTRGCMTRGADRLGIARRTLYTRMERGLNVLVEFLGEE